MMRELKRMAAAALVTLGASAAADSARAAVDVNSVPHTTGELVALCSTPATDPMHSAAVSFCNGFALGAVTVEIEVQRASRSAKLFCLPEKPPTVEQGIAAFVTWANASPSRLTEPPADGLLRYLEETYPCRARVRPSQGQRGPMP